MIIMAVLCVTKIEDDVENGIHNLVYNWKNNDFWLSYGISNIKKQKFHSDIGRLR